MNLIKNIPKIWIKKFPWKKKYSNKRIDQYIIYVVIKRNLQIVSDSICLLYTSQAQDD